MLENEILDGDHLIEFKKALEAIRRERILTIIIIIVACSLCFLGFFKPSALITGLALAGVAFLKNAKKSSYIYYYTWKDYTLTLFTTSQLEKKGQLLFPLNSIKKIRTGRLFLSKKSLLKIETHTQNKSYEFVALNYIDKNEIKEIIKEVEGD